MEIGSKKLINAWAFYDWANSAYSLVISTAVFPIFYAAVVAEKIDFLGITFERTVLYDYTIALAFFIVAIISPLLSGIADYTGNKKKFMQFFCYLGATACMGLFFFDGENVFFGLAMSLIASIGFWGSLVFYNAFLPEVAKPEQQDAASAKGFAQGYIGSTLLLIVNLVMIMKPALFGFTEDASKLPSQISFLMVGLWWIGFAQITYRRLPNNVYERKPDDDYFFKGYSELRLVWKQLSDLKQLKRFLGGFFFYSMGVQTVILLAGLFGKEVLELETDKLIKTIIIIQFVGIGGAYLFAFISKKMGNISGLKIAILLWAVVCVGAFLLDKNNPSVDFHFYALGGLVGLVMGGIQALSRSTYSKMLPETQDHATYFSFYDVTEKVAVVIGMFSFGLITALSGSMQNASLVLLIFFMLGFIFISRVKKTKYVY